MHNRGRREEISVIGIRRDQHRTSSARRLHYIASGKPHISGRRNTAQYCGVAAGDHCVPPKDGPLLLIHELCLLRQAIAAKASGGLDLRAKFDVKYARYSVTPSSSM